MNMFDELRKWRIERGLDNKKFDKSSQFGHIAEEMAEGLRANSNEMIVDSFADIIVFSVNAIEAMGYDAEICMQEVIKEISSRKGDFNPELNKWEKFRTPEAMALWYSADFSKAKR